MPTKQTEANKRWIAKNKAHAKYLSDRSRAKSFINKGATLDDLDVFMELLETRRQELKNINTN